MKERKNERKKKREKERKKENQNERKHNRVTERKSLSNKANTFPLSSYDVTSDSGQRQIGPKQRPNMTKKCPKVRRSRTTARRPFSVAKRGDERCAAEVAEVAGS